MNLSQISHTNFGNIFVKKFLFFSKQNTKPNKTASALIIEDTERYYRGGFFYFQIQSKVLQKIETTKKKAKSKLHSADVAVQIYFVLLVNLFYICFGFITIMHVGSFFLRGEKFHGHIKTLFIVKVEAFSTPSAKLQPF